MCPTIINAPVSLSPAFYYGFSVVSEMLNYVQLFTVEGSHEIIRDRRGFKCFYILCLHYGFILKTYIMQIYSDFDNF